MNLARFSSVHVELDALPRRRFAALAPAERWNGWTRPYFTHHEAKRLVAAFNGRPSGCSGYYDPVRDIFAFDLGDANGPEEYGPVELDGRRRYPIGAGVWTWWSK